MKTHYKTIVVSDLHLGIKASKAKEISRFLKHNTCDNLILNGDIIDGWQLRKGGKWKKKHTKFFKLILNYVSKRKSKVIYVRGNHDDFLDEILPFQLGNFSIKKYFVYESFGKRFFVVHGDLFDTVTNKFKWMAKLGDVGYTFLLWLNRHYNTYREKKGLPYYSLSQVVKSKVKSAVSFITDFENELAAVAKARKCDGIICGHIHQACIKKIDGVDYYNSGDWVETLSALVEDFEGNWSIVYYADWLEKHNEEKKQFAFSITLSESEGFSERTEELIKNIRHAG